MSFDDPRTVALVPKCRFCGSVASVVVYLDQGCACYPNDRWQYLCAQHDWKSEPIGSYDVVAEVYW